MKRTLLLALIPFLSGCGLRSVHGPPSNWQEIQDVEALETMALSQPCTAGKSQLLLDALGGGVVGVLGVSFLMDPGGIGATDEEYRNVGLFMFGITGGFVASAIMGNQKANDCRAFIAHLLELRQGGASSLTSHEWLDELFPLPDLGVTGFDPVFGVPINQDH